IDPYTSGWSMTDNLCDDNVRHWTGDEFPLMGVLRVDGKCYRFMGCETVPFETVASDAAKYAAAQPAPARWMTPDYDDRAWTTADDAAAIASAGGDMLLRRTFELGGDLAARDMELYCTHSDAAIYLNGIEIAPARSRRHPRDRFRLTGEQKSLLREGRNVLALRCRTVEGSLPDAGILVSCPAGELFPTCARQTSADVQAMQTHYAFDCGPVALKVIFTAPLFADDPDLLSRPVNYITYEVTPTDGEKHDVAVYFEASPAWALCDATESESEGFDAAGLRLLKTGSAQQNILGRAGDYLTIDWGCFYLGGAAEGTTLRIGRGDEIRRAFIEDTPETSLAPRKHRTQQLALSRDLGTVGRTTSGHVLLGYDDIYSIQYFGDNLRPWWNRDGSSSIVEQFEAAERDYALLRKRCERFDNTLMAEAEAAGGRKYAELCAAAYRQTIAAHKLVESPDGEKLLLSKECFSNGSIGTVDISYPSIPLFLRYNPELAEALLNHIFRYCESERWPHPFPAHDVGTYPLANGETYIGEMPVEESGNMLIMTAAISRAEGSADYADKHWEILTAWTDYLVEHGLDPENQLCTDDFAGHLAHNANLSVKAILGIAAYGDMARMRGDEATAEKYTSKARELAAEWVAMADDGDHYRLTFDRPGTWSQKYNLVWDKVLGWGIFPDSVRTKELACYLGCMNAYGLPLDCREDYTKTDWVMWTAAMADDNETFEAFVAPLWSFMNETTDRVPMSDWVFTSKPEHRGFRARSVVGGYWMRMLDGRL
ncbi:MAG: DUF4965 domain-containing protein, partial [Alistipes sp.]|nr:DUF4965 domain-containing protein [Alistipes sp.]